MNVKVKFSLDEAIAFADKLVFQVRGKHLSDLEHYFFKRCWEGAPYRVIAEETGYALDYINGDIGYHLWRSLSDALEERVKRSNFKTVLERCWQKHSSGSPASLPQTGVMRSPYVERPPLEERCYEELLRPGGLLRIKAPKKFGKTHLMDELLADLRVHHQYLTVPFNILRLSVAVLQDLDLLLRALCDHVSRKLGLGIQAADHWPASKGACQNCIEFFEDCVLPQLDQPLVIAFDNVDLLFPYQQSASDFLGMLRGWHEEAKGYELWENLRLIIAHSTDAYIPLSIHYSPFNVGLAQEPQEFDQAQVMALAAQLGLEGDRVDEAAVTTLMDWVGGHPDLVQRAFQQLRFQPEVTLSELMVDAATDSGLYEDHLRELWVMLEGDAGLMAAFASVIEANEPLELPQKERFLLSRLGVVVLQGDWAEPRNQLYRLYFQHQLQVG